MKARRHRTLLAALILSIACTDIEGSLDAGQWEVVDDRVEFGPDQVFTEEFESDGRVVRDAAALKQTWREFAFEDDPPDLDLKNQVAVLIRGVELGRQGPCSLDIEDVRIEDDTVVLINEPQEPDQACNMMPIHRGQLVVVDADAVPDGDLRVSYEAPIVDDDA